MLPKVTISGISCEILEDIDLTGVDTNDLVKMRELEKHHIVTKIVEKNPSIKQLKDMKHTLDIVYMNKVKRTWNQHETDELTIGLKLSPSMYHVIYEQQQGTMYLGSRRYRVIDRFYIKQCYHCQQIGHTSADCIHAKSNKAPVCMYCAGEHRSSSCPNKKIKETHMCGRCLSSPHRGDTENAKTHNAGSPHCPVLIREHHRQAANTDFTSKNVM